jgi:hypothetical protein
LASITLEQPIGGFPRAPHRVTAGEQDTLPSRYGWPIKLLSLAAFTLAFVGWLNETWLFMFESPIWLNRYTEYAIILAFGTWRIVAEKNAYTRRRLVILVGVVTGLWWLVPWLNPFFEPYIGYLWSQPVFPSLHTPGTLTFFLVLALVFLFGRRVICGFGCPCVGIRETVGFAFRENSPRGELAWKLRHMKWVFFVYYVGVLVVTQYPPNSWTISFVSGFYGLVAITYFGTFFIAPLVGNRAYCRFLCPFGATFGLLNHAGFYDVKMDEKRPLRGLLPDRRAGNPRRTQRPPSRPAPGRDPSLAPRCRPRTAAHRRLRRTPAAGRDPDPGIALPRLRRAHLPHGLPAAQPDSGVADAGRQGQNRSRRRDHGFHLADARTLRRAVPAGPALRRLLRPRAAGRGGGRHRRHRTRGDRRSAGPRLATGTGTGQTPRQGRRRDRRRPGRSGLCRSDEPRRLERDGI